MYAITVSRHSRFFWLFRWFTGALEFAWGIAPDKLNVCNAVWGTVFYPLGLLRRLSRSTGRWALGFYLVAAPLCILGLWLPCWPLLGVGVFCSMMGTFAMTVHRQPEKTFEQEEKEREESEKALRELEDSMEGFRNSLWEFRTNYPFAGTLILLPFTVVASCYRLTAVVLAPILVPLGYLTIEGIGFLWMEFEVHRWEWEGRWFTLKGRHGRRKRARARRRSRGEASAVEQAFVAFHDRTCRTFKVVE